MPRRHRAARLGHDPVRRTRADGHPRHRAQRLTPRRVRVRVPVRPAGAGPHLRGERRPAPAAERHARGEAERTALSWMRRLEVEGLSGKRPGEVSGGQGQRVAVARSLATGPRVVLADGPTGALDSLNGERVMELFTEAARSTGAPVVLVTHEARVAAYSDREVVVRDGKSRDAEYAG
ncbi:ATP-binding cassette domain-containing protein [Streptomyces rubiginosohelvolus]